MSTTPNIIRRFHAGEPHAFAEIISEYKDAVYTVCARMLGPTVAENAAENIFVEPIEISDSWNLPSPAAKGG